MTEPSELERVARAIYAADWPEPHHNSFDECPPDMRARYINLARAALSAMPDPLAMAKAMQDGQMQGQAEGFAGAVQWLRERSACKPPATLWHAASILADQLEQSRIPMSAIDPATLEVNHATD